jgi:carbonic anhydrase/acetyltransferase-like protein (isoleucine patch superfamily)
MIIYPYKGKEPEIAESAYIAENAVVTGDVKIGDETSIWFNSVIRGDVSPTIIGKKVSIQDNSVLHQSPNNPLIIEDEVTIGHQVILHSCKIRKGALIGMGSIVLDEAEIGEGAFIGAGSLVPAGGFRHDNPRPPARPVGRTQPGDLGAGGGRIRPGGANLRRAAPRPRHS